MRTRLPLLLAALLVTACSNTATPASTESPATTSASATTTQVVDSTTTPPTAASTTNAPTTVPLDAFADRPYEVFVPGTYDPATATPLVILLHGYTATGALQELYFQLQPQAEARGFLYVHPDGLIDRLGNPFWNATPACCDAAQSVDDAGYIISIIDAVSAAYNVDQRRIFLVGHSNGGFMSYRMACEHADRIAAIASLAGATFLDPADCAPSEPVSVLQIHGTADGTIAFNGGSTPIGEYPAAVATVQTWAGYNGCGERADSITSIDVDFMLAGDETTVHEWADCPVDGAVELWTIVDGGHIPARVATFGADILDWLFDHPNA